MAVGEGGESKTPPSGPPPANPQSSPNLVAFDPKLAVPSQPLYLQRNDFIAFFFQTNTAGLTVRINYRWLTPEGEIKEGEFDSAPLILGITLGTLPIYEGWLLSFAARTTTGSAGQWIFLQACITRGTPTGTAFPMHAAFWQGYIYNSANTGWPGIATKDITDGTGTLRSITGTTPALGAEINEVIPSSRRWKLLAIQFGFTTSAAVASRNPRITLDDGANLYYRSPNNTTQAASSFNTYVGTPGLPYFNDALGGGLTTVTLPLPADCSMKASFRIRTSTSSLQAGDQYGPPQYLVAEWGLWDV